MLILGLDASSKSYGWCIYDTDVPEEEAVLEVGHIKLDKYDRLQEKLQMVYHKIREITIDFKLSVVVIEDVYLKNVDTLKVLSELRGVTRFSVNPLELHCIGTTTMKKQIGLTDALKGRYKDELDAIKAQKTYMGRGNKQKPMTKSVRDSRIRALKKNAVMDLVNERFGLELTCDDESDAVAIAYTYVKLNV